MITNNCAQTVVEALSFGSLRVKPCVCARWNRILGLFAFQDSRNCDDTKLESADAEKRQGKLNNRNAFPRSGRLTDYTREFVTWVMRLQANYRIEQPVLRNAVLIGRLGLFSLRVEDGIKGGLKAILYGSYHPCITY